MVEICDPPVVALLTDMGQRDWYVGTMKGVLLSGCPRIHAVDICHEVGVQQVAEAAFVLATSYHYFQKGTIFLTIVDPGVGSRRDAVVARSEDYYFVAPNNGLLTLVAERSASWEMRRIENESFCLPERSDTFHGRDVFSPAAARLAAGADFEEVGPPVEKEQRLDLSETVREEDGALTGRVLYIDHFGNLITNVSRAEWEERLAGREIEAAIRDQLIRGLSPHYAAVPQEHPLIYWGSSGLLELAINHDSAARKWDVRVGEFFRLEWK